MSINKEIHVTLPTSLWERLNYFTQEYALGISPIVREAIYEWIARRELPYKENAELERKLQNLTAENQALNRKIRQLEKEIKS